jgi:hypothetical protein
MNKGASSASQFVMQLPDIRLDCLRVSMNQGVRAENEIERPVLNHVQGAPVVLEVGDVRSISESPFTVLDASWRQVHDNQMIAPTATLGSALKSRELPAVLDVGRSAMIKRQKETPNPAHRE